jgi:hypothetical protein
MKYFKIIVLLIIVTNSISCQNKKQNMNWEIIDFSKIPGETLMDGFFEAINKYHFEQILILDQNHLVLLGDNSEDRDKDSAGNYIEKEKEAVAFISVDGGKTLKKHIIGKGSLKEGVVVNNTVFLVNEQSRYSSQLIKMNAPFEKWEVVCKFDNEGIIGISFFSTNIGIAHFFHENSINQETVYEDKYTLDGGKNWKKINNDNPEGFEYPLFISSNEIEYIEHNQLVKLNFITGEKEILTNKIAPDGYRCEGYFYKDPKTNKTYTFIENKNNADDLSIKYLPLGETIRLPNKDYYIETFDNYFYAMIKDGIYYNYVWSDDKGKTWHTEELRDFFVIPRPIGYYGKGFVYAFVNYFKGKDEEKGGRFAIRKPTSLK